MEMLPFYLGGFGILVLALLGYGYFHTVRIRKRWIAEAYQQLSNQVRLGDIRLQLQRQGLADAEALQILELAQQQLVDHDALQLLQQGKSENEVIDHLTSFGTSQDKAIEIVGIAQLRQFSVNRPVLSRVMGILLFILGIAGVAGGLMLWFGNKTGQFVTFPFAGQLVIGIGVTLIGCCVYLLKLR